MTEDEKVGWHHRLDGHEFEQALKDSEGQGSLVCCNPWAHKELFVTEQLNTDRHPRPQAAIACGQFSESLSEL